MNALLCRILERYDLDKPILMKDKLDIIWDKSNTGLNKQDKALTHSDEPTDNANRYAVKFSLGRRKVLRAKTNAK